MFQLCPCTLVFGYKTYGNFESGLGHMFLFVGLRYANQNFKVRRSGKNKNKN